MSDFKKDDYCWVIKNGLIDRAPQHLFESVVKVVSVFSGYCVVKDRYNNEWHVNNECLTSIE